MAILALYLMEIEVILTSSFFNFFLPKKKKKKMCRTVVLQGIELMWPDHIPNDFW